MIRRYGGLLVIACLIFILADDAVARKNPILNPTIMVPARTISSIIKEILPYKIDFGKHFPKDIWVQSIDNIKIKRDKILFRVLIYGKNVGHILKIGDHAVNLKIGKVSLTYACEATYRFDRGKGTLFVTPKVKDITSQDKMGKGNMILSPLLEAMSDIEYPIAIRKIEPFVTGWGKNPLVSISISQGFIPAMICCLLKSYPK